MARRINAHGVKYIPRLQKASNSNINYGGITQLFILIYMLHIYSKTEVLFREYNKKISKKIKLYFDLEHLQTIELCGKAGKQGWETWI